MKTKPFLSTIIFCSICLLSSAQIIHIPADQPTIQEGINAASNGDTILAADGTYLENINFNGKAITVASQFIMDGDTNHINNTIIDGSQPSDPDYGSVVTFITGEDTTSIISGFTISGGTGMIEPVYITRIGGGIVCYYATPKIINNKIIGNVVTSTTDAWGGGVYCFVETGNYWSIIENNAISGNQCIAGIGLAAGGGLGINSHARIENNIISNNYCSSSSGDASGGGIYHESSDIPVKTLILKKNLVCNNSLSASVDDKARGGGIAVFFSKCIINQNSINENSLEGSITVGGGLIIFESDSATVTANVINHNSVNTTNQFLGAGCACIFPTGPTHIENNMFYSNSGPLTALSASGGGLQIRNGFTEKATVTKNIFINNTARFGGGFYSRNCYDLSVTNNLFSGNVSNDGGGVGMYITASSEDMNPEFINNTFVNNIANFNGGAVHFNCESNLPILFNNIFYENDAPTGNDISFVGSPDPIHLFYSDFDPNNISGPWTGEGNIYLPPEFIVGDTLFHLSLTSPCKNAGIDSLDVDGTVYYAPLVDYDGEGRPDPLYHMFDMGADENWEAPSAPNALNPVEIGEDYFIAQWESTLLATGYYLDVAFDENFTQMVLGYDNLDVGTDTTCVVTGLGSFPYYYRVRSHNALYTSGNSNTITVLETTTDDISKNVDPFVHMFPNPTCGTTSLNYFLPFAVRVSICIYDLTGNKIRTLVDEEHNKGEHSFQEDFSFLPEGLYLVRMQAGHQSITKKLIVR